MGIKIILSSGSGQGQRNSGLAKVQKKAPLSGEEPCKRNDAACVSTESGRRKALAVGTLEDRLVGHIMIGEAMLGGIP